MIDHLHHTSDQLLIREKSLYSEYFDAVYNSWLSASVIVGGEVHRYLKINGFSIHLSFCGSAMISDIMPAFNHLACTQDSENDLTICLWDSKSTQTEIPAIPWKINDRSISGEIWRFDDKTLMIVYQPVNNTIMLLNKVRNLAIYWLYDASAIPYHDKASPLRLIFQGWMRTRQCQVIHAGAIGFPDGGVLLVGKGGSGKSNTTLNCLNSELLYIGDDYCLITDYPYPYVYSLYNTGKLNAHDIDHFPSLKPAMSNQGQLNDEKALYFFHRFFPEKISNGFPVLAILIPEISRNVKTTIRKVSPAKGFIAMAPTTIFQTPKADQPVINHYLDRFVRKVSNYVLELGTDRSQVPGVITDFIKSFKNE